MTARLAAIGVLAALASAACGSSTGGAAKAGAPPGPTVLRLASPSGLTHYAAVGAFVDAVRRRSGGRVVVRVLAPYGPVDAHAEQRVLRGVASHEVDLGWVRTGAFDLLGVTSLQALSAPMLITSYGVEAKVLDSDLPAAMLAGVGRSGVTGLAVLAGPMRRPFGVKKPLLGPGDYDGLRLAAYPSRVTAAALATLGAGTTNLWGGQLLKAVAAGRVDGFERTLRVYVGDAMVGVAPYVTTNVTLWPQTLALIASPAAMDRLTAEQRRWVEQAAAEARERSIALARGYDDDELDAACESGAQAVRASTADADALRARFASVYADLDRDAPTRSYIARIRALAAATPADPPLAIPASCADSPPVSAGASGEASPIDGTYRWTLTVADKKRDPNYDPTEPPRGDDVFTVRLAAGRWQAHDVFGDGSPDEYDHGTFRIEGDRLIWTLQTAGMETDSFRFRLAHGWLTLHAARGDPGDVFVMTSKPWRKIK